MRPVQALSIFLAAALGCQAAPKDTSAEARRVIAAAEANWARLTAAGHADSLAELFHLNAVALPPNWPPMSGRQAIRIFLAHMNETSSPPPLFGVRPESVWVSGPLVVELGRWHFDVPPGAKRPAAATIPDSGKYMARWVNENGHWLIMESIWNSDLPVATPPAQKH